MYKGKNNMIEYKNLVKGHIYRTKSSFWDPSKIIYYVGKAKCIVFKDCGDHGSALVVTCDWAFNYVIEQDITDDYEFGLEENHFSPPDDHTRCYHWKVQPRNHKEAGFIDISHAVSHIREILQYGVSNIGIMKLGTFMFCEGKLHFSEASLVLNTELKDILLEILIDSI